MLRIPRNKSSIMFKRQNKSKKYNNEEEVEECETPLLDSLINVNGNTIMFNCDIDSKSAFLFINAMNMAIKNIQELNPIDPLSIPIVIYINSDGGEVYQVLSMISCIKKCPYTIHTVVSGCVSSAAVLLAMAGDKRMMDENAYMLVHEIRSECWGKYSECIDDMYNNDKIMKDIKKYFQKNTNNKFINKKLEKLLKRDIILNAKKCLKYGIIHRINYFKK